MAPVSSTSNLILLTGGNGFIGAAVLSNLLARGFHVRAAVRSQSKGSALGSFYQRFVDSKQLTFAVVPDFIAPGAFDVAVEGVDAIIHCASPLVSLEDGVSPNKLIDPAVKGTIAVLESAYNHGKNVKRIVLTSSAVTIFQPHDGKYVYTEADWNDQAAVMVSQQGANAPAFMKYIASKVLAERAAWAWINDHKTTFDLTTVLPPWVWGKSITSNTEHIRPEASNYRLLTSLAKASEAPLETTEFTDVLDVAEGHIKALMTPEAGGQRFLLKSALVTWQDVYDILNAKPVAGVKAPIGTPGAGKDFKAPRYFSPEKSKGVLGMTYRPVEDTVRDTFEQAVELGWQQ